jgi:hypothetical protein
VDIYLFRLLDCIKIKPFSKIGCSFSSSVAR